MRGFTPLTSDRGTPRDSPMQTEREEDLDQNEETEKKPAILMSEGTLQRVAFKERPKPIVPTSSLRKTRRRAGMQLSRSKFWWHYKVYRIHIYLESLLICWNLNGFYDYTPKSWDCGMRQLMIEETSIQEIIFPPKL